MRIKELVMALAFVAIFAAAPAFANDCMEEILNLDHLINPLIQEVEPEVAINVNILHDEAVALCETGQEAEALVVLDEIKALLGI
jgi:hypothetical protein